MPMADDDEGIIKERLFLDKDNPNILHNEMTTIDNSLTRPWTVMKTFKRQPKVWWAETNCVEGRQHPSAKKLFPEAAAAPSCPSRKDQPPPDLKYFKQVGK